MSLFFCISLLLMSNIHVHPTQAHNLGHTGSHILLFFVFLLNLLDFGCCSSIIATAFTAWFCSLRQESAADWGGCCKSIIARSEATCFYHVSLSLSLSLLFFSLWSVSDSRDDRSCPFFQQMQYCLYAAALNIVTQYASEAYLPLQISLNVSELSIQFLCDKLY